MLSRARGFTLVEMVVALTLLSMIVLATLTAMRTLAKTQTTLTERTEQVARMRAVSGFLRRTLEQARLVQMMEFGQPAGQFFYGTERELTWAAPLPIPGMQGGLAAINLSWIEDEQLVLRLRDGADFQPWGDEPVYILAEGVQAFSISYRQSHEEGWLNTWDIDSQEGIPTHVRIVIQMNDRYWPEIIVPLVQQSGF